MVPISRFALLALLVIHLPGTAGATDPIDPNAMQAELKELRSVVERLQERIRVLEAKFAPKADDLRLNDIVSVKFLQERRTSEGVSANDEGQQEEVFKVVRAAIVDMLPNGDYILTGERHIHNNGYVYRETLTGKAHRSSFDATRCVRSDQIRELSYKVVRTE